MPNVTERFRDNVALRPDAIALRSPDHTMSYRDLDCRSAAFAAALRQLGVAAGDRVVLVAPTVPEFAIAFLGTQLIGAITVPVNTMATAPEIGHILDDSGAMVAIAWHATRESAEQAVEQRGRTLVILEADAFAGIHGERIEPADRLIDDTAVLLYTSGTTGKPKGVELTVANLVETARIFIEQLRMGPDERMGTGLPLFHVFGLAVGLVTALHSGASFSLLTPFEPRAMIEMIRDHRLTMVSGVPTMWNAMLHTAIDIGPADFTHLRLAASGGASLPAQVIQAFSERFGCTILEGYGLTESSGAATYNPLGREQRVGSVGSALPGTSIEIRDLRGELVPQGVAGELYVRGPSVMKGYWNSDDATASELVDGWLKTGDLACCDADGYVYIVGRAKDLIIRGGYNVYPREVEEVLYQHPDIVEVAVIGLPDERYGEEVGAAVVTAPGSTLNAVSLRAWAKQRLSAYKVPHLFAFVDELPKGPTGKILTSGFAGLRFVTAVPESERTA
ncbi:long-chain fatty acid--CoA ligase [Nocardia sp. NPDC058518]|uniref:long-chain-fatty-acid--CoA ligase n=1 Tax=Nocardia sp. NPDC058518 TaxID=3346534 RepID=UPI003660F9DE